MCTANWNWKKWLGLSTCMVIAVLGGCKDSKFSDRKDTVASAQFYGPNSQPYSASVRWQQIDNAVMQSVCSHSSLRELNILTATRDGSPIFPHVAKLPNLEMLNVVEVPLNDDEFSVLREANGLKSLELSRTGITGSGLAYISKLPIKRLIVREKHLSPEGLQAIAGMTELEELELWVPGIHLADIPALASSSKLRSVKIKDGHFSFREFGGLKFLQGATNLTSLSLSGANLNDRSLKTISTLKNLQNLSIEEGVISEEGIELLSTLENLQSLELPASQSSQDPIRLVKCIDEVLVPLPTRHASDYSPKS